MTMDYVLTSAPPTAAAVTPLLTTRFLGRQFVYEQEVVSTNRSALDLAEANCPAGLIVVAETQSGGRGRMTRSWFSPPGRNLYFSFVLRPSIEPAMVPQLALLAALSLRRALLEQCSSWPLKCKWPNDLWADGRKISGILCEMTCRDLKTSHVVVGIGVNVNVSRGTCRRTYEIVRVRSASWPAGRCPVLTFWRPFSIILNAITTSGLQMAGSRRFSPNGVVRLS